MTSCPECQRARETAGRFAWYCPKCLWCGARLIARIQTFDRPRSEINERCRKVLADWMAMGHDEQQLRTLAKTELPLEPTEQDSGPGPSDSVSPVTKRPAQKRARKSGEPRALHSPTASPSNSS